MRRARSVNTSGAFRLRTVAVAHRRVAQARLNPNDSIALLGFNRPARGSAADIEEIDAGSESSVMPGNPSRDKKNPRLGSRAI